MSKRYPEAYKLEQDVADFMREVAQVRMDNDCACRIKLVVGQMLQSAGIIDDDRVVELLAGAYLLNKAKL